MALKRSLKDAKFILTKVLPAANANNNSDVIDLEAASGDPDPGMFDVEVSVPALANHTDSTKTITIQVYDSADNSSFAEIAPRIECRIPGVASTGSLAKTFTFRLPPEVRRYLRFNQAVPSGDGDNTASSITYSLLF